jgi:hypothetical protein
METHSHSHTPRQKWTHYFWEFLMLFLAVTLGFFVENEREHYIERKRERKYIQSIIEDLKADTALSSQYFIDQNRSISYYDSVVLLLSQDKRSEWQQQRMYYMIRMAIRLSQFNRANENAYEQMKNSGNLRLLHSQKIIDSISRYYFNLKEIESITDIMTLRQQAAADYEAKIFDGKIFQQMVDSRTFNINPPAGNPALIIKDPLIINEFIVKIHYVKSIMLYSMNFTRQQKMEAIRLIQFLQKEYNLE